jgi:hypothetical protein
MMRTLRFALLACISLAGAATDAPDAHSAINPADDPQNNATKPKSGS